MDPQTLKKLSHILEQKFWEVAGATVSAPARDRWREKCESLGIRRYTGIFEDDHQIFEEFVVVIDPYPGGNWLEMTKETAEKILSIGMP